MTKKRIDTHCHIFNFDCVPDSYFDFYNVQRNDVVKLALEIDWLTNNHNNMAHFLVEGTKPMEKILDDIMNAYPGDYIFSPLMMDMEYGIKGNMPMSYTEQRDMMIALKNKYPDKIFPFLAVDPRRPFIESMVKEYVGKNKAFAGIKIYPPMGYLPTHPVLMKVFKYCCDNRVPITTHCSIGLIKTNYKTVDAVGIEYDCLKNEYKPVNRKKTILLPNKRVEYFTRPENWLPVLEEYRELFLNFAHFGGGDEWEENVCEKMKPGNWVSTICNLLLKYPNTYTDISFTFRKNEYLPALNKIINSSHIGHKILYGTDFYMLLSKTPLADFINKLDQNLSATTAEFNKITIDNPNRFLFGI